MRSAKVGDKVRVKGYRQCAVVAQLYTDIKGGVKLDRLVDGFCSWNVKDLVRCAKVRRAGETR